MAGGELALSAMVSASVIRQPAILLSTISRAGATESVVAIIGLRCMRRG